jgi:hypothetical protein
MPLRLTFLFFALLAVVAALPAAAGADTVARPGASTSVREYGGTLVFSRFDAATREYRLAIRRPGRESQDLPVAPADRPFDADIGPGANGGSQLVYVRCDETCDLFSYALGAAVAPSRAGGAQRQRPGAARHRPDAVEGPDRVGAHLRRAARPQGRRLHEAADRAAVAAVAAPPGRTDAALRRPRCAHVRRHARSRRAGARALGDNLAQTVTYECRGCAGTAQHELRLVDVSRGTSAMIAYQAVGLGGQQLVGPSFHNGWLGWYKSCFGDPDGCGGTSHGPWRYGLRYGTYAKAPPGPVRVDGFVDEPQRQFRVEGCSPETQGDVNADCRIEQVAPETYRSAKRPGR